MLLDNDHKENRFYFGATARILELLYGDALILKDSTVSPKKSKACLSI